MNTEITLTFPYYVGTVRAMKILREALLANEEACWAFSGQLIAMSDLPKEERTTDSVSLSMHSGAIVFPEAVLTEEQQVSAALSPDGEPMFWPQSGEAS